MAYYFVNFLDPIYRLIPMIVLCFIGYVLYLMLNICFPKTLPPSCLY